MQFRKNTSVVTLEGVEVGRLGQIVLHPETKEVTHLVLRKGPHLAEDKVVPLNLVSEANEHQITLREEMHDANELPPFVESRYVLAERGNQAYWQTPLGGGAPISLGTPGPHWVVETGKNIPEGTVALQPGAKVIAADGKTLGVLEQVLALGPGDQATHFGLVQGRLIKERRRLPVTWVSSVRESEVHLTVNAEVVDELGFSPDVM